MAQQIITDFRRTLTSLLDLGRQGLDRVKDDLNIAERITPISRQALDFYSGIASGGSEGSVDPAGGRHIPVFHPVKGHEITHHELLQKFGLRDELAQRLLTTAQDLLVNRDIQSPSR